MVRSQVAGVKIAVIAILQLKNAGALKLGRA
jgi:hypothetical protein